jgi:ubiquinone/menaquinone biosynthesis C-methylase UbiE
MSEHQGFRIAWAEETSPTGGLAQIIQVTEAICTPFAVRQFHLLNLLPPKDSHPRVLDNACGSGRQTEVLHQAYAEASKAIDITCCDVSPGMVAALEARINGGNWTNVKTHILDAEVMSLSLN